MNAVSITLFFARCFALLQVFLTALVILRRAHTGVDFLDGGDQRLLRRMRAHGNLAETAPLALLLMALLEYGGVGALWLWSLGASLLTDNAAWSRRGGMVLTLAVLSLAAVRGLVLVAS